MKRRLIMTVLVLAAIVIAFPAASGRGASATSEPATSEPATGAPATQDSAPGASEPSDDDRRLRTELVDLAEVWSAAGGRFGYPFWDKAAQRWRAHEISAPLFREYVTGYRDRLVAGCELLGDVDIERDEAGEVRDLLQDACDDRIEGLKRQRLWLDELIRDDVEPAVDDVDRAERDEKIAQLDTELNERFDSSFRSTRLAMNLAQTELEARGLDRLPESAFV